MIKVTIDLHAPGRRPVELATIEISNQSHTNPRADYSVKMVYGPPGADVRIMQKPLYSFDRLRWNVLGLLVQALEALGTEVMTGDTNALTDGS
jgi:hypothetical protein